MISTFRERMLAALPWWWRGYFGGRLAYSIGVHLDAFADMAVAAVMRRFPGFLDNDDLAIIGRDRTIQRGVWETDDQYAARLPFWWDTKKMTGNARALLRELRKFIAPRTCSISFVYNSGRRWTIAPDGTITESFGAWNWDGLPASSGWSRFWILLHQPSWITQTDGTWADDPESPVNDSLTWSAEANWAEVDAIRQFIADLVVPHCKHVCTIVILDENEWNAQQPDGTWGRVGNRNPSVTYWDGSE